MSNEKVVVCLSDVLYYISWHVHMDRRQRYCRKPVREVVMRVWERR